MIAIKKDIGIPKSCSECLLKASDYVCGLLDCTFSCNHFKERNYNCPLVEIEERKVGKWIMPNKYYDKNIWRKCSVCNTHFEKYHKYIAFTGEVTYTEEIANYCKVCGAEMVGAENE